MPFAENYSYDPNGNILTLNRNGDSSVLNMDQLSYKYIYAKSGGGNGEYVPGQTLPTDVGHLTNQLSSINDAVSTTGYTGDLESQPAFNYTYDAIGELTGDQAAQISNVTWNVYGKILSMTDSGNTISFTYDAAGNRISKTAGGVTTWYVRDASGNVLSTYTQGNAAVNGGALSQIEADVYGSSRLGVLDLSVNCGSSLTQPALRSWVRGSKLFELTNHLGNVLATISDRKLQHTGDNATVDYYLADVINAQDYYPFGMGMPGRSYTAAAAGSYRYGFNGQEKTDEIAGVGNHTTAEFWEYDSRAARRWNLDPKPTVGVSEYSALENSPIQYDDVNGDCTDCPVKAPFGTQHSEKDAGGTTPLGGFLFAGKDAMLTYTNIGNEKESNWVISSFQNKAGESYSWNDEKKWYVNSNGDEYHQSWYHNVTDWGFKQFGKPLSEAAKNVIEGSPLKDTRAAYSQYESEGGGWGIPGFFTTSIGNSLSQWGSDLFAGGHRSGQAFIGAWQFSADVSLNAGLKSTKSFDLLSLRNGYGPFGEEGLRIGNYQIDMLYRNPASGIGHGTLFSIKQLERGGNLLRWDYGTLHAGGEGWHSTFRFTIRSTTYGSNAQRSWAAPFFFFKYKRP